MPGGRMLPAAQLNAAGDSGLALDGVVGQGARYARGHLGRVGCTEEDNVNPGGQGVRAALTR